MDNKEKRIKILGNIAKILSILVAIPSIILLFNMLTGKERQSQYGYSMYTTMLLLFGTIPALISIILGAKAYSTYRKNKQSLSIETKKRASSALIMPISCAALMLLITLLDTFVFK